MSEYILEINGQEFRTEVLEISSQQAKVLVNGREYLVNLKEFGLSNLKIVATAGSQTTQPPLKSEKTAEVQVSPAVRSSGAESSGIVKAPLPGLILNVLVKENDPVKAGQTVIVMEAMKMENQIQAPLDGVVKKVLVKNGDTIAEGDLLIEISRPAMTTL